MDSQFSKITTKQTGRMFLLVCFMLFRTAFWELKEKTGVIKVQ